MTDEEIRALATPENVFRYSHGKAREVILELSGELYLYRRLVREMIAQEDAKYCDFCDRVAKRGDSYALLKSMIDDS
jgi:hypothetical protein